ncbi:winged helix-turn-helix transcriptional regulator [Herbiconiux sp. P16]|uniref:winged helix-turn-helix transcriptional regulator n=1 Tax=Herbiconiux wuyangfengii TaxID=3342794 RepID=UPI0035BA1200
MAIDKLRDSECSVARSLSVLGERWTLLLVREALSGSTRFDTFQENLQMTPGVLSDRLSTLVECGVLRREEYREAGQRARSEYFLTDAGRELHVVVGALQQWGDEHLPTPRGPSVVRRDRDSGEPVRVAFTDLHGREVAESRVAILDATG